jgi:hypothetical protein
MPLPRSKLNHFAAHIVHRGKPAAPARRYPRHMRAEPKKMSAMADEFDARAATFRRVAGDMRDPGDRAELLRIAEAYEEDAARLRTALPSAGS